MYEEAPASCACQWVPTHRRCSIPPPDANPVHSHYAHSSAFSLCACLRISLCFTRSLGFRPWVIGTSDAALTIIGFFRRSLLCRRWLPYHRHPFHGLPQFRKLLRSTCLGRPHILQLNHQRVSGFRRPEGSKVDDYDWNMVSVDAGISALVPCTSFQKAPERCYYRLSYRLRFHASRCDPVHNSLPRRFSALTEYFGAGNKPA